MPEVTDRVCLCLGSNMAFKCYSILYCCGSIVPDVRSKKVGFAHLTLCTNLSKVCYIAKMLKNEVSFYVLRNIYFAKFQSLMRYGIIL
jgi:hypothetical protein